MTDRFSDEQVQQLEGSIRTIVTAIVREEVAYQLDQKIPKYLEPMYAELKDFRQEAREDADALNGVLMQHDEDTKQIKRHVGLPVAT